VAKGLGASKVPARGELTQIGALDEAAANAVSISLGDAGEVVAVGRYAVSGILGRGGMGVVYAIEDRAANRSFALKMVETRFLEIADNNAAVRFRQEISVLERLDHPGIVRLFDSGIARHPLGYDLAFFVMERLEGDTLDRDIKGGRVFSVPDALTVIRHLADALDYLARSSVLHRDIKPANIFLDRSGRTVLMDFGLARSTEFTRLTLAGQIVGTFGYMAPERLTGRPSDVSADVYALGVVLYQMLAGHHPWIAGSPTEMLEAIKRGLSIPPSFQSLPSGAVIETLIREMLAYKADARPPPATLRHRIDVLLDRVAPLPEKTKTGGAQKKPVPMPTVATPAIIATPIAPTAAFIAEEPRHMITGAPMSMLPAVRVGPSWSVAGTFAIMLGALGFAGGLLVGRASSEPEAIPVPVVTPLVPRANDPVPENRIAEKPVVKAKEPLKTFPPASFTNPGEAYAYAETLLSAERYAEAIPILDRALQLNPAYADAHKLLGDAHFGAGEPEQAQEHYKTYLALRPGAEDAALVKKTLKSIAGE
jgi:serine/threonine-protein kinase